MKKDRGAIPEWMNSTEQNLDYNDETHKKMKFAIYKAWVLRGHGGDWFSEDVYQTSPGPCPLLPITTDFSA